MAYNFLRGDRDQPFLLPPDLRDWLPQGHLAWFILDVVDQLDLQPLYQAHRDDGHGHPPTTPRPCWACCYTATASACAPPGSSNAAALKGLGDWVDEQVGAGAVSGCAPPRLAGSVLDSRHWERLARLYQQETVPVAAQLTRIGSGCG
jgi:hypothetical protein